MTKFAESLLEWIRKEQSSNPAELPTTAELIHDHAVMARQGAEMPMPVDRAIREALIELVQYERLEEVVAHGVKRWKWKPLPQQRAVKAENQQRSLF